MRKRGPLWARKPNASGLPKRLPARRRSCWGLFSLVPVLALRSCPAGRIAVEGSAWYRKSEATFADCLALVRQQIGRARYLVNSAPQADCVQLPQEVFALLLPDLPLAAQLAKVESP